MGFSLSLCYCRCTGSIGFIRELWSENLNGMGGNVCRGNHAWGRNVNRKWGEEKRESGVMFGS